MLGLGIFNNFRKNRMHQSEEIGTTGLYIDVENLQDRARTVIEGLIADWPVEVPKLRQLNLYVRADQAQLWELWANSKFPGLQINVKGIQHFSLLAKNSADITIAVDAVSDFLTKKVSFICLLSDDSDFISVHAKVRELQPQKQVPFLWILTDREGTKSTTIRDYFPTTIFTSLGSLLRMYQLKTVFQVSWYSRILLRTWLSLLSSNCRLGISRAPIAKR